MKLDMNIDEYLPLREVVFHTLRRQSYRENCSRESV